MLCASFVKKKNIYKKKREKEADEESLTRTESALTLKDPVAESRLVVVIGKFGEVSPPAGYFSTHSTKQRDFVNKVT